MSTLRGTSLVVTGNGDSASKGLRKATQTAVARPTTSGAAAIDKAVTTAAGLPQAGNLGFIVDATASRKAAWAEAKTILRRSFQKSAPFGKLTLRLVHYGGGKMTPHPWSDNPDAVAAIMDKVDCVSGSTQIIPSLEIFLDDAEKKVTKNIILSGDSFEEDIEKLKKIAERLAKESIRVFAFLEGNDPTATIAFQALAETTGGLFKPFDGDMPDICAGIAMQTVGGRAALAHLPNARARQLLLSGPQIK
jgi:hypothetical protein